METTWGGSSLPGNLPVLVSVGSTEAMQALKEQKSSCEGTPSRCSQPQETPGGRELRRHPKRVNQGTKSKGKAEEVHPLHWWQPSTLQQDADPPFIWPGGAHLAASSAPRPAQDLQPSPELRQVLPAGMSCCSRGRDEASLPSTSAPHPGAGRGRGRDAHVFAIKQQQHFQGWVHKAQGSTAANSTVRSAFSIQPSLAAKSCWLGLMGSLAFLPSVGGFKKLSSSAGS